MTIPPSCDGYYLPPGEHPASIGEVEQRFAGGPPARVRAWWYFEAFLRLLDSLNLYPHAILINGSFVTGRAEPRDVDAAFLFLRVTVRKALAVASPADTYVIYYLLDPANTECIRDSLGLHALACRDAANSARGPVSSVLGLQRQGCRNQTLCEILRGSVGPPKRV